ncbi:hypothetical protein ACI3L1_08940 [Deinococcus sp. SM5_A1]|uniref:hypothetical protein n=1 Tax=Deinococcus sp. SM5_A1 TaxID=3379094 RepID=UPI00385F8CC6
MINDLLAWQFHDLPDVRPYVTEYEAEVKVCPHGDPYEQAAFPAANSPGKFLSFIS